MVTFSVLATFPGYIEHFVASLQQDDASLQQMLNPRPDPLKALYIYESKMSLLARVASSPGRDEFPR